MKTGARVARDVAALDPLVPMSLALVLSVLALVFVVRYYHDKVGRLRKELREAGASRQSLATTYGRITEQWAPFLARYPHDPQRFRFIGGPIDGIQFADDRIVFVEIKASRSALTPEQRRIRQLVEERRVEWLEFRVEDARAEPAPAPPPLPPRFGAEP